MRCPKCNCQEDKVIDSRSINEGAGVRRRRECVECDFRYNTLEEVINEDVKVIKKNGIREDFSREKIREGVNKACWKRPISSEDIDKLTDRIVKDIEKNFDKEVTCLKIGEHIMDALKELDEVAYIRFASVYRQFKDIDQFVEAIKNLGSK